MKTCYFFLLLLCSSMVMSQETDLRQSAANQRMEMTSASHFANMTVQNIGPSIMSGRVSEIKVNPKNTAEFYVAYASSGLWHTTNNGTTFSPIFDQEAVMTIGAIAVDWNTNTLWVGTGEVNSSRSSYAGNGVYKSTDNGKTWSHMGLIESHHIGRIVLHPTDNNTAWVAALGHLYTTNQDRGIYKTTDGGITWQKTLFINDNTGAVDLIIDPTDSNVLYAATWERSRKAWDFQESGKGSTIYKSTDGGDTWQSSISEISGFPQGDGTGRIGLDICHKDGQTYVYAILDNYNRRPKTTDEKSEGYTKSTFENMSAEAFELLDDDMLQKYLERNGFPEKYSAKSVKKMIKNGEVKPLALKEYVEDANSLLFDTPVVGAEVYVSVDEGKTWKKTHDYYLDNLYNSYGYYFGQIRANPKDPMQLYILGVPLLRSDDGGNTWIDVNGDNVHSDHHELWINPSMPSHIINGNDGGVNISYDSGDTWIKCNNPAVGQFYSINIDNAQPFNVYGGLQDNGVWVGSSEYSPSVDWHNSGDYPYDMLMGGDGMQIQIDSRNSKIVYTGFQFGNYFRIDRTNNKRSYITPKHKLGDSPYRWNWQTPILLSKFNQDILYMGSNKLLRSMDQGRNFTEVSGDLTRGGKKGDVAYGTITTITESPFDFGTIYTGSDDGLIHVTKDAGYTWTNISDNLPADKWVSRVVASAHEKSRVYASLNGYRNDDFKAYLYRSDDYGVTWTEISGGLPSEPINVVKEDPDNENIIYVGTDHGLYTSLDKGNTFMIVSAEMPRVAIHDLVIHTESRTLIIGTHGRSLYKLDVSHLKDIDKAVNTGLQIYELSDVNVRSNWGSKRSPYSKPFEPKVEIKLFTSQSGKGTLEVIMDKDVISSQAIDIKKGISTIPYDLTYSTSKVKSVEKHIKKIKNDKNYTLKMADNGKYYLPAYHYTIRVTMNGKTSESSLNLKERS